jgi:hypothetical protein
VPSFTRSRFTYPRYRVRLVLAALLCSQLASSQGPIGVRPRAPADYAVSGQLNGATFAASVLSNDQVKHIFATDISRTYIVVEVACFPGRNGPIDVHPDDFLVKTGTKGEFVHPADGVTVASVIQRKDSPPPPPSSKPAVHTEAAVGYSSGTDEYGRRVHQVYTEAGVAVGPDPNPPPYPQTGAPPPDRQILEQQLMERALGEGRTSAPVAGYLYFPAASIKKSAADTYQLQYFGDSGQRLDLPIPTKRH